MSRIRTIKPDFFLNDILAELPCFDRLLFIGLWTLADREGRLEDRSRKIKAAVLPYDDYDVDKSLTRLAEKGFITRYKAGNDNYIQINNFLKHQYPNVKESESTIPAQCLNGARTPHSGKGKEGKGNIYSAEFLLFWELYKKKVDKSYAFTCFKRIVNNGVTSEMVINHVLEYNKKIDTEQTELQFIKNPSTFLNKTDFKEKPLYISSLSKKEERLGDSYKTL